jgi:general secretion pathway protein G
MMVLALMAMLAGVVVLSVRPILTLGKQRTARAEIATICSALENFYSVHGRYPTSDEGVNILTQKTDKLSEGLLQGLPVDPWGQEYHYTCPGRSGRPYDVICYGSDGREGGSGADEDVTSWKLKEVTK